MHSLRPTFSVCVMGTINLLERRKTPDTRLHLSVSPRSGPNTRCLPVRCTDMPMFCGAKVSLWKPIKWLSVGSRFFLKAWEPRNAGTSLTKSRPSPHWLKPSGCGMLRSRRSNCVTEI